ncbi:MAG: hypothetical protein ACREE9_11445 [Stellaceae bacterium]
MTIEDTDELGPLPLRNRVSLFAAFQVRQWRCRGRQNAASPTITATPNGDRSGMI